MDIRTKRELIHIHSDLLSALCLIDELDENVIDSSVSAARAKIALASQLILDKVKGGNDAARASSNTFSSNKVERGKD